jgi:phosphatidylglycerophosphatase A
MPIKESSDELNPAIQVPRGEVAPRKRRSASDYVALAIATCGVGYFPIAPGTMGSIVGVLIYVVLRFYTEKFVTTFFRADSFLRFDAQPIFFALEAILIVLVTLIGIWAASRVERLEQKKDPGKVVIDEVAGQLITLLPIPLTVIGPTRLWILLAFFLFRAFDIVKPYPVRRLEKLESGLGIVIDDVAAGAYAAAVLAIVIGAWFMF